MNSNLITSCHAFKGSILTNIACIAQIKRRFIKCDKTKHISPKFFYTHKLQEKCKMMFNRFGHAII